MSLSLDHPWLILLLLFALPALSGRDHIWHTVPSLQLVPRDRASLALDVSLRCLAAATIAALVFGLAGLHAREHSVSHVGRGAHIALVLDRSLSMDEPFALQGHKAVESKSAAAATRIEDFFSRRPQDSFAIIAFSTAAIQVLPLTAHRDAVAAALRALRQKALANTNIGGGLILALRLFGQDDAQATRVILLVSDGAGYIAQSVQDEIRAQTLAQHVHIYYLYLRAGDEPPLAENMGDSNDSSHPAALDGFLRGLGVPYRGFEAADPGAIDAAAQTIAALETRPITYAETVPRLNYDYACYGAALMCLACLLLARLAERNVSWVTI